jgi:hypothetical protein
LNNADWMLTSGGYRLYASRSTRLAIGKKLPHKSQKCHMSVTSEAMLRD